MHASANENKSTSYHHTRELDINAVLKTLNQNHTAVPVNLNADFFFVTLISANGEQPLIHAKLRLPPYPPTRLSHRLVRIVRP